MGAFEVELALERLEAQLAAELPAHVRAFAAAHAAGNPAPPPPPIARQEASIEIARKMLATSRSSSLLEDAISDLSARAQAVLRLLVPIAIEDDSRVAAARTSDASAPTTSGAFVTAAVRPTWDAWLALAAAREAAARARFGLPHVVLMHALHGRAAPTVAGFHFAEPRDSAPWPAPVAGWHDPMPPISPAFVERAWRDLASIHGATGTCRIVHAEARPRAFVVEPGREVTVVVGAIDSAAARFATLHELGHALAALLVARPLARIVDEAVAAYTGRLVEHEAALDLDWYAPIATPARARRLALTAALDAIEREPVDAGNRWPIEAPPWTLWNDPAAQAAYVVAESIAERWWSELGASPAPGALAAVITDAQRKIDLVGLPL